ncbi:hypothetical protein Ae201684_002440 [Aphanomyces euteiches]|uniref:Uncharacterized protein n=1 Tax=Aphanomyces euteiches TaxID=100861 RepID=A0A6G0XR02_9STRA|nr:hypothetical protein Ae201684_002440 [Aphanomyces euteiches]
MLGERVGLGVPWWLGIVKSSQGRTDESKDTGFHACLVYPRDGICIFDGLKNNKSRFSTRVACGGRQEVCVVPI